jgi:hypothetical protein
MEPSMANAQLQALQYVQNKFGRESLVLGGHHKVQRLLSMLLYLLFKLIVIELSVPTHHLSLFRVPWRLFFF